MPINRLRRVLAGELAELETQGRAKGDETVFTRVVPAGDGVGPRFELQGEDGKSFLRMNSNSYLGMSLRPEVIAAEEEATRAYGTGPGAVRFISGTYDVHLRLERRLAEFHGRERAMLFSSAYATTMGTLPPLLSAETAVISDSLNHNCIINAIRSARPKVKHVYPHLDMGALERALDQASRSCRRAVIITDGIFSMRGDHAPLPEIVALARKYDEAFAENALVVVDDSHGVGAFGETGRGTEEYTNCEGVDLLIATLGKALGVNGGYVAGSDVILRFLREQAAFYIYSNPITPAESAAALAALNLLDGPIGRELLTHLRSMTRRFEQGLVERGFETIAGEHPVVPLMVRDTARTSALVNHLKSNGILATGLNFPVVPNGDEEIRFQISADHTPRDVDHCLEVLSGFSD